MEYPLEISSCYITYHQKWTLFEFYLHINISTLYEQLRCRIRWHPVMLAWNKHFREAFPNFWVVAGKCGIRELHSLRKISNRHCAFGCSWIATTKKFPCTSLSASGDFGRDSVKWNFQFKWDSHGFCTSLLIARLVHWVCSCLSLALYMSLLVSSYCTCSC